MAGLFSCHKAFFGKPKSGKSTLGGWIWMHEETGPRIWWDPNEDFILPAGAVLANPESDERAFRRALEQERPIVWRTGPLTDARTERQVAMLHHLACEYGATEFYDEAHMIYPQGRPNRHLQDGFMRGRHFGPEIRPDEHAGITIGLLTPSPQKVDKSCIQVGTEVNLFALSFSGPWLKEYGVPPEAMTLVNQAGPHAFVRVVDEQVTGPFRLDKSRGVVKL